MDTAQDTSAGHSTGPHRLAFGNGLLSSRHQVRALPRAPDVACDLVHSLAHADFVERDRVCARAFGGAAAAAGVSQIVYLGGLGEDDNALSPHLRSRLRRRPPARDPSGSPRLTTARAEDVVLYWPALAFYGLVSVAPLVVVALWVTSLVVGPTQIDGAAAELARFSPEALGADRAFERVAVFGPGSVWWR